MRSRLHREAPGPRRLWEGNGLEDHHGAAEGVGREGWSGEEKAQQVTHLDLMHGRDYAAGQRIAGWLVQEKFDGLRCLWTGTELVSRNGERFHAPAWFTAGLPVGIPLDGELYAGVGSLGRISNLLARHKSGKDVDWQGVRFMVFDAPTVHGSFAERASFLRGIDARHTEIVATLAVESLTKLRVALKRLHKAGGEGFILRDPSAPYVAGRTGTVLKFKSKSLY